MRKSAPIEVVVHYPKTEEGWEELGKRVATAHANYVIEKIERLNCPTWQKLELYQAVIDTTTRVPISPRNTRNPAGSPAGKQSPTLNICPVHDGVQPQLRRLVRRRWWWRKPQQQWRWRRGRQRVRLPDRYCSGRGADPDRLGWLNQSLQVKHRFSLWGFFESACRKRRSMIA